MKKFISICLASVLGVTTFVTGTGAIFSRDTAVSLTSNETVARDNDTNAKFVSQNNPSPSTNVNLNQNNTDLNRNYTINNGIASNSASNPLNTSCANGTCVDAYNNVYGNMYSEVDGNTTNTGGVTQNGTVNQNSTNEAYNDTNVRRSNVDTYKEPLTTPKYSNIDTYRQNTYTNNYNGSYNGNNVRGNYNNDSSPARLNATNNNNVVSGSDTLQTRTTQNGGVNYNATTPNHNIATSNYTTAAQNRNTSATQNYRSDAQLNGHNNTINGARTSTYSSQNNEIPNATINRDKGSENYNTNANRQFNMRDIDRFDNINNGVDRRLNDNYSTSRIDTSTQNRSGLPQNNPSTTQKARSSTQGYANSTNYGNSRTNTNGYGNLRTSTFANDQNAMTYNHILDLDNQNQIAFLAFQIKEIANTDNDGNNATIKEISINLRNSTDKALDLIENQNNDITLTETQKEQLDAQADRLFSIAQQLYTLNSNELSPFGFNLEMTFNNTNFANSFAKIFETFEERSNLMTQATACIDTITQILKDAQNNSANKSVVIDNANKPVVIDNAGKSIISDNASKPVVTNDSARQNRNVVNGVQDGVNRTTANNSTPTNQGYAATTPSVTSGSNVRQNTNIRTPVVGNQTTSTTSNTATTPSVNATTNSGTSITTTNSSATTNLNTVANTNGTSKTNTSLNTNNTNANKTVSSTSTQTNTNKGTTPEVYARFTNKLASNTSGNIRNSRTNLAANTDNNMPIPETKINPDVDYKKISNDADEVKTSETDNKSTITIRNSKAPNTNPLLQNN